jgi:ADP-ribose pyrophosphatase YjhB (NUDIX family)
MSQLTSAGNADATYATDRPCKLAVAAIVSDDAGHLLLCQLPQGRPLWGLPGGRIRDGESPIRAVIRDVREETGAEIEVSELVGLYQLTGGGGLPDVAVHVFRGRWHGGEVAVNAPGKIVRLCWHEPDALPEPLTATTRAALADAVAGRSGVVKLVSRDVTRERTDITGATQPAATAAVS